MKLMIVLSRFPLPARKGDKLRAWEQLKGLSEHFEIHLVCMADEEPAREDLQKLLPYVQSIKIFAIPVWKRIPGFLNALFSGIPFQVAYFASAQMRKYILNKLQAEKIPVCYTQLIRLGKTVPHIPGVYYLLDYMDALSAGMNNRVPESRGLMRSLYKWEARRLAKYEKAIVAQYDAFCAITAADAKLLPDTGPKPFYVIPNGVSADFFETTKLPAAEYDLLFTGNMGYFPNVKAASYLVEEIYPIVQTSFSQLRIALVGTDPSEKVKALASDGVKVTGFISDMRTALGASKLFVAPLFTGSGLQNKLLEAMAAGLPVLTTPLANEALGAVDGESIMVCRDAREFSEKIILLLQQPEIAGALGQAGQAFVRANYGWKASNEMLARGLGLGQRESK